MPKISVILPFYNAEKTLNSAIISILNQSFSDFELLLINNNSTDKSFEVAKNIAKNDNRVILLSENKQGVVFATQKGFDKSNTKIIARADADDIWHKDKLKLQYNFLKGNKNIDVVSCRVNYIGKLQGMKAFVDDTNKNLSHNEIVLNRFSELQVINPTIMFRKKVAIKLGLYKEGNFPEDYEMFLRWIENNVRYHKLSDFLLNWHDSNDRLTRTDKRYSFEAFYKIKSQYLFNFLRNNNPFFPNIVVWGAGKQTKKRITSLIKLGIRIKYFIDVDENKINNKDVISYKDIALKDKTFIVSFVNNRGVREKIKDYLISINYKEGIDFIIA